MLAAVAVLLLDGHNFVAACFQGFVTDTDVVRVPAVPCEDANQFFELSHLSLEGRGWPCELRSKHIVHIDNPMSAYTVRPLSVSDTQSDRGAYI
jgi:hypothetical protein